MEEDLGISPTDREIIEKEVEIIFHTAATVKFNAVLREATYINIRTLNVLLDMAKNMKNLKAFVHVSTAFSSMIRTKIIEEKFYEPLFKADKFLTLVECIDDSVLDELTPILIKPFPNTYVFTKSIAEDLCREKGSGIPLCIFRPAGIISCFKEPLPGWINNAYGSVGYYYGIAIGVLKVAYTRVHSNAPVVPGDFTINACILSAYHVNKSWENRPNDGSNFNIPIINYSNCFTKFALTWKSFLDRVKKGVKKYPFYSMVTLPSVVIVSNSILYRLATIIFYWIPAIILDSFLMISCKKPKFRKLYQGVLEFVDLLAPFSLGEWIIKIGNINEIYSRLSEKDKEIFYCDLDELNIEEYIEIFILGMRRYLAKENDDTLQKAFRKRRRLIILNYVLATVLIVIFVSLLMRLF
ncbi:fatty acyl-CoA reductase wat-like [Planococcus citri]|uniref:fatty acyl-CoA reductase wat-like n=1 Tax=Planococcus citri TaxID=170843 RepID=UPI0031F7D808